MDEKGWDVQELIIIFMANIPNQYLIIDDLFFL